MNFAIEEIKNVDCLDAADDFFTGMGYGVTIVTVLMWFGC